MHQPCTKYSHKYSWKYSPSFTPCANPMPPNTLQPFTPCSNPVLNTYTCTYSRKHSTAFHSMYQCCPTKYTWAFDVMHHPHTRYTVTYSWWEWVRGYREAGAWNTWCVCHWRGRAWGSERGEAWERWSMRQ